ncbi:MAG TPA: alpha/beta hydrolase [bacterium]|jgi:hypothetical protein
MNTFKRSLLALALVLVSVSFAQTPATPNVEGMWLGTLSAGSANLRIVIKISRKADNSLSAVLDSPDQGAKGIPADEVMLTGDSLHVGVKMILGGFDGKVQDSTITGHWSQRGQSFPLSLTRVQVEPELARPQMPKKPYPYLEEDVSFVNAKGGDTLAGTFTHPEGSGPFTTALLISGSGPQDRDESIAGHKPFLVIADYLTRQGIAVLRVDDRGVGKSTGKFAQATTEDFATDAEAAIAYLKTRPDVNGKRIGLIGHSEGALVADMLGARSKSVAFIVTIAGPGVTGEEIIFQQGDLISKVQGMNGEEIARNRTMRQQMFDIVRTEKDSSAAATRLRGLMHAAAAPSDSISGAMMDMQIRQLLSPWMRSFLAYDPRPDLKKITCPLLAIFGEKDLQVPPQPSSSEVAKALEKGKSHSYEIKILPGLNHLMQTAESGSPSDYARIEETFSPEALKIIGDWIGKLK